MELYKNLKKDLLKNQNTWLITGVAGFIGSNLLEELLKLNQKVIGIDNLSTGNEKNLNEVKRTVDKKNWKNFHFYKFDIRDLESCRTAFVGVDYVLHQAALGSVPRSLKDPLTSNEVNIAGFLNILVLARDHKVKGFVYAASSSTYGDNDNLPKIEENIGNPLSPYAITKYVNELYADIFFRSYNFDSIGLRYFNVFGKRQDPKGAYAAVIPKWIGALLNDSEVIINGDGTTTRDFCFIDNVIQANLLAATTENSEAKNNIYNVALGDRTSLNELYKFIKENIAVYLPSALLTKPIYQDFRKGDVKHAQASIEKAKSLLGYAPKIRIKEGLMKTIEWYIKDQ